MATPITAPKTVNGYTHFHSEKGIHSYTKHEEGKGFILVECTDDQLHNGDIEFLTTHGMTISKEMKKKFQKNWEKKNKTLAS
jgi:hypothetical protein